MPKKPKLNGFVLVETMVVIAFLATTLLSVYSSFTNVLDNAKRRIYYDDPIYLYRTYYLLSYLEKNHINDFINDKIANVSGNDKKIKLIEFGCEADSVTNAENEIYNSPIQDILVYTENMTVSELAAQLGEDGNVILDKLDAMGLTLRLTDGVSFETANAIATQYGKVLQKQADADRLLDQYNENLAKRMDSNKATCESIRSNQEISHIFIMNYDVNDIVSCKELDTEQVCQRNKTLETLSTSAVNYLYTLDGYTGVNADNYHTEDTGYRIVVEFSKKINMEYEFYTDETKTTKKYTDNKVEYYYTTLEIPYGYDDTQNKGGYYS